MADQTANDVRFKVEDWTELLDTLKDSILSRIRGAMPVQLTKDSEDGHTVEGQPTVKGAQLMPDGTVKAVSLPTMPDVPTIFMGGGGIHTTHGLKKGDEVLALASYQSYDYWHQQGGVQSPGDGRTQALSDVFCLSGVRSDPNKLKGVSPNSTQTRTVDKKTVHDVSHTAVTTVREEAAHQVNGMAIQTEIGSSHHHVDKQTIQQRTPKFLHNCGLG